MAPPVEVFTTRGTPYACAALSTFTVPSTFTRASLRGVGHRLAHVDLRGQVEDHVRLRAADEEAHRARVADVDHLQLRAVRERLLEVLPLAGGDVVEHDHLVAAREQRVHEVRADEAGAACHECLHAAADARGRWLRSRSRTRRVHHGSAGFGRVGGQPVRHPCLGRHVEGSLDAEGVGGLEAEARVVVRVAHHDDEREVRSRPRAGAPRR